jgi:hypothetical protein
MSQLRCYLHFLYDYTTKIYQLRCNEKGGGAVKSL